MSAAGVIRSLPEKAVPGKIAPARLGGVECEDGIVKPRLTDKGWLEP